MILRILALSVSKQQAQMRGSLSHFCDRIKSESDLDFHHHVSWSFLFSIIWGEQLIVHFFIFLILLAIAVLKNILFINSKLCFKVDNTNHFLNLLILSSMWNCCHRLAKLIFPSGKKSWLPMLINVKSCRIKPLKKKYIKYISKDFNYLYMSNSLIQWNMSKPNPE